MVAGFLLITFTHLLISQFNSFSNNDLIYERFRTKDYVRNFNLFMQNEPKFYNSCIIISSRPQRTYNIFHPSDFPENEPKRTQNEPKPQNPKMIIFHYIKRTYNNFSYFALFKNEPKRTQSKPKTNPIQQDKYGSKTHAEQKIHPQTPIYPTPPTYKSRSVRNCMKLPNFLKCI